MLSINETLDVIDEAIEAESALDGLSTSNVAEWVAIKQVVATAGFTISSFVEVQLAELDERGKAANFGTLAWFADTALEYQDGDPLVVVDGKAGYATIDESKRIIKQVAVVENDEGRVVFKVVKVNNVPLTNDELIRFTFYINRRKAAGIKTAFISQLADLVWPQLSIRYDGSLILSDFKVIVEAAINDHLASIYFNGRMNINLFRDAIEKVSGVAAGGVAITSLQLRPDAGVYVAVTFDAEAYSGHFKIDPAHPLSDVAQINYIAV